MSTIIMDLCSYTRLGLTGYLLSRGVKKREINDIETVDDLAIACDSQRPSVVFINEDCFIHDASNSQHIKHIKHIINQHPNTLFIVFMAIANVHFDEYLLVRKNLLISSKSIKTGISRRYPWRYSEKRDNDNLFFKYADVIIEPNRIEYVANVDGRSGNDSNL